MKEYRNVKLSKQGRITIGIVFILLAIVMMLLFPKQAEGSIFFIGIGIIFLITKDIKVLSGKQKYNYNERVG